MKFDYVIGNPPYQEEAESVSHTNGQKPRKNIFHYFQLQADAIAKNCTVLIYPGGRWIHQSGKGLKTFGQEQINDKKLAKLTFYPDSTEIFGSAADLSDGISIVVKNQNKISNVFEYEYLQLSTKHKLILEYPGNDLIPLNPNNYCILKKLQAFITKYNLRTLHSVILPRTLFGIESDFVSKNHDKVREYHEGEKINWENEIKLYANDKAGKAGRTKLFIANKKIINTNKEYIAKWKVVVSSANAGGQKRDNQIEILDNHTAFGRSRVALSIFNTQEEAKNFFKYATCYIIRFAFLMTDEALSSLALKVPDISDYTHNNQIINFKKDIDTQLEKLIGLNKNEISYIRETINNLRK